MIKDAISRYAWLLKNKPEVIAQSKQKSQASKVKPKKTKTYTDSYNMSNDFTYTGQSVKEADWKNNNFYQLMTLKEKNKWREVKKDKGRKEANKDYTASQKQAGIFEDLKNMPNNLRTIIEGKPAVNKQPPVVINPKVKTAFDTGFLKAAKEAGYSEKQANSLRSLI